MDQDPRLSVVVTGRNDDHGGGMLRRFRVFAEALIQQADRHGLKGELLVVEWNPPPGPRLREALGLRVGSDDFRVRFIEVPGAIHARLANSGAIPLFQMIAKNVGIRRARGRFVLATNPDLLFSDELLRFLAREPLDPSALYRLDRTDTEAEVPEGPPDLQLAWCAGHVLRVHTRWGSFAPWRPPDLGRLWQGSTGRLAADPTAAAGAPARPPRRAGLGRLRLAVAQAARSGIRAAGSLIEGRPRVHTNGCGDFTLLSRDAWHRLRAYPELPIWSMHLDSLLCYMAVAAGCRQHVLRAPARMYHLEHASSWVVMDVADRLRTFPRKPWLDTALLEELRHSMLDARQAVICNDADWGLGRQELREAVWGKAGALAPTH